MASRHSASFTACVDVAGGWGWGGRGGEATGSRGGELERGHWWPGQPPARGRCSRRPAPHSHRPAAAPHAAAWRPRVLPVAGAPRPTCCTAAIMRSSSSLCRRSMMPGVSRNTACAVGRGQRRAGRTVRRAALEGGSSGGQEDTAACTQHGGPGAPPPVQAITSSTTAGAAATSPQHQQQQNKQSRPPRAAGAAPAYTQCISLHGQHAAADARQHPPGSAAPT